MNYHFASHTVGHRKVWCKTIDVFQEELWDSVGRAVAPCRPVALSGSETAQGESFVPKYSPKKERFCL